MKFLNATLAASVAASMLALAGCGSSSSGSPSQQSSSASSSTANVTVHPNVSCIDDVCTIAATDSHKTIMQDLHLTADKKWLLQGLVVVGDGHGEVTEETKSTVAAVTLTVDPGVHVRADDSGTLLISRGSKILAEGTLDSPITFSSVKDDDFDGEGEWGGIVVQGFAPQYDLGNKAVCYGDTGTVCNVAGEGFGDGKYYYGGDNAADNSGILKYVRIAEGGLVAAANSEINGLTLMGVGHETELEYIQVHGNKDDGIEWFGGTVNLKHAVLTNNDDDDIDFDQGYKGNIQHVIVRKHPTKTAPTGSNDPRGIEANSSGDEAVKETEAVLANITIIGSQVNRSVNAEGGGGNEPGIRLRGDVTTQIWNSAVTNFYDCVRTDSGSNTLKNFLGDCDGSLHKDKSDGSALTPINFNASVISFDDAWAIVDANAKLDSAIEDINAVDNGSAFVFDKTDYIGAVNPDVNAADRNWHEGWTLPGTLSESMPTLDRNNLPEFVSCTDAVCTISGMVNADFTLTSDVQWALDGLTIVGNGHTALQTAEAVAAVQNVTLTIQPGVSVGAFDDATLLVTRGSKLMAKGTRAKPITFSSAMDADFDGNGEWGGIVIQGFAPQVGKGSVPCSDVDGFCNVAGEGFGDETYYYGGNDVADNSGVLNYVRIAEGGKSTDTNSEINGLTLMGVGYKTHLEYIQVHGNLDDGIEWFGGTVNLKHAVLTNNDDDDIDFDEGYQGNIQFAIVRKDPNKTGPNGANDPRGIEANSSGDKAIKETSAVLSNITIIGSEVNKAVNEEGSGGNEPGMRLRGNVTTQIWNSAVSNFTHCVRTDSGSNTITNFLGDCDDKLKDERLAGSLTDTNFNAASLMIGDSYEIMNPEAVLASPVAAIDSVNDSGFEFELTDYIGAVDPSSDSAWWAGWVIEGSL